MGNTTTSAAVLSVFLDLMCLQHVEGAGITENNMIKEEYNLKGIELNKPNRKIREMYYLR